MEYLHSRRVVHFDLKCDNLLCDLRDLNRPVVKIGDLGLSKKKAATFVSGNMRGTLPWMAPELFPSMQQEQDPVSALSLHVARLKILKMLIAFLASRAGLVGCYELPRAQNACLSHEACKSSTAPDHDSSQ